MVYQFPESFTWGTATASFQIEGATKEGGRGESIWDRFAATPGKISTGETGDPACDSYHLYAQDIKLMKDVGAQAYRFSTAWPRILPDGNGAVNEAGLDYYDRVVDALLEAGIVPYITLYHWDLPQALQESGGWVNRATIDAFVRYTDVTVARLGDRVKHWMTLNEPWCISMLSHFTGEHAPGLHDKRIALQVAHNILVAHGLAVPVIREHCTDAAVGIAVNFRPSYPATDSEADAKLTRLRHAQFNEWFLGPITGKGYPQDAWADYGDLVPDVAPGDFAVIAPPLDFLGVNFYRREIYHDPTGGKGTRVLNEKDKENVSARGWEIFPQALYDLLTWLNQEYGFKKMYITENGMACDDEVTPDGQIHDPARIAYMRQHLEMVHRVIGDGVPVAGYFAWSLLDNFEWAFGTASRFGICWTDFKTQQRIVKDSGRWFCRVAHANALVE